MSYNLTDAEEARLLDLSLLNTDKLALMAVLGSDSVTGTEVSGGSYARQTLTFSAAATTGGVSSKTTSALTSFTSMPAGDVQGWAVFDTTGASRKWYGLWSPKTGTAQASGDTVTSTAHGYTNGQKIVFQSGYAPAGLTANTTYYVVNATTDTFQVSATSGGSAIDITADGSGIQFGVVKTANATDTFNVAAGALTLSLD